MSSLSVTSFCHCGFLTYLVLFSFYIPITSSVSLDLTELRNKVAKIKVNPRGNLWATGHFMGKKSIVDSERVPPRDDSAMKAIEAALNPQQVEPADLYQEMLRIALQTHLDSQEIRTKVPETAILMKILESYIQDYKNDDDFHCLKSSKV